MRAARLLCVAPRTKPEPCVSMEHSTAYNSLAPGEQALLATPNGFHPRYMVLLGPKRWPMNRRINVYIVAEQKRALASSDSRNTAPLTRQTWRDCDLKWRLTTGAAMSERCSVWASRPS